MATSSSYDYSENRNEIITDALAIIGEYAAGETISDSDIDTCSKTLNKMIKAWQAKGYGLWLNQEIVVFLQADDTDYSIGPTGDHCASTADAVKTELAAAVAAAGTSLTVDSITGIADGDYIGIETSNGDIHWDVVNGSPSGTTVTITTGLDYAAVVDAHVYAYTSKCQRPLSIIEARIVDPNGLETPLYVGSREEYMAISDKDSEGTPSQVYYDSQTTNGVLYVWPEPDNVQYRIYATVRRPVQDFDAAANDCDFPQEWMDCITWNLAKRISPKFGRQISPDIREMAAETLSDAMGFDKEDTSIYIKVKR